MTWVGLYLVIAVAFALALYSYINRTAWAAPRLAMVLLAIAGGLFWWVTLLALLVVWVGERVRRRAQ